MARRCSAVVLLILCLTICGCSQLFTHANRAAYAPPKPPPVPAVPTAPPANSVAVFNFRCAGDADSKYYAIGFARALAARLYCAPECITHQPTDFAIQEKLALAKHPWKDPIPDELAIKVGKRLGVRYVLTGDFRMTNDQVEITSHLLDVTASSPKPRILRASGKLADLPAMQASLTNEVAQSLKLKASFRANFSNPGTLLLCGKSMTDDCKDSESICWQAVKTDPKSSFAVVRLLLYYADGPKYGSDLINNKRLNAFMKDAACRYPDDSHVNMLIAWVYDRQYHYRKAEAFLRSLIKRDPNMVMARDNLACMSMDIWDADTAILQGKALVKLWPTSARAHEVLAQAYEAAANNARHARFYNDMSPQAKQTWRKHCEAAFVEASTALKLDDDNYYAWTTILDKSRELGHGDYVDKAFKEMVRIAPKNEKAYIDYAYSFAPKWGGSKAKQEEILKIADKEFGPGSVDSIMIRESVMTASLSPGEDTNLKALKMLDLADKKWKRPHLGRMKTRCWVLFNLKRYDEALKLAKKGFAADPSPDWRLVSAKAYGYMYEKTGDRQALDETAELMKVYVEELPLARHGHTIYGWALSHQGKTKEAREQFLTALKIDPEDEAARKKLKYVGGP